MKSIYKIIQSPYLLTDITQSQLSLVFPICFSYYFIKSRLNTILIEKTKC